jgi:hypothetical protein
VDLFAEQRSVSGVFAIGTWYHSLSQLFGSWVHWWRRVPFWVDAAALVSEATPFLWRCRKNRKPRLDFSSRCLTCLRLARGRISTVEYVG